MLSGSIFIFEVFKLDLSKTKTRAFIIFHPNSFNFFCVGFEFLRDCPTGKSFSKKDD